MFYDRFVALCKQKNMSPSAVTRELGLNNSISTAWKRGTIPNGNTLQKLADYFGVTVDYLLGNETKEKAPTEPGERTVSDEDIMFALFNGADDITDEMFEEVKRFAQFIQERERNKPK